MTILGAVVLAIGAFLLLAGTALCFLSHNDIRKLIIRGCIHDAGFACIGLACPSAMARAGVIMYVVFQAVARALAYYSVDPLAATTKDPAGSSTQWQLRGSGRLNPAAGALFTFGMLAAVGSSAFFVPEGRELIVQAVTGQLPGSAWGTYAVLLAAVTTTVQVWLSVAWVNAVVLQEAPRSGVACTEKPCRLLLIMAGFLALFGIFRGPVLSFSGFALDFEMAHDGSHAAFWLMYLGAFAAGLCHWSGKGPKAGLVGLGASLLALLSVIIFPAAPLTQLFLVLITLGSSVICLYSLGYMAHGERLGWYWFFLLLTFASLAGIVSSSSPSSLYGNWELMTFASFFLVAHEADPTARAAGLKYYVMCAGGAMFMLPGVFILAGGGYLLPVDAITAPETAAAVASASAPWLQAALAMCIAGFGVKAGIVPLHSWLPDAHPAAPSSVSGPLSGIITKMGFFGLAVVAGHMGQALFAMPGYFSLSWFGTALAFLGSATLFYGEFMALRQKDIKRMLAYSTLGQIGEITIVLGLGTVLATTAGFFHILNHAIMKDLLFLGAGALILRAGTRQLSAFAGAASQMPVTCCCMTVGLVSIMGLPPFAGFYSKFTMIQAAVSAGHILIAALILLGSFIGVMYYTRILNTIVFMKRPADAPVLSDPPATMQAAMIILAGGALLFGLVPDLPYSLAASAAAAVCGVGEALPASSLLVCWPSYVILPIFGAVIPAFFRSNRKLAGAASVAVLLATALLVLLFGRGMDNLSFAFALIVPLLGALNMAYAIGYMDHSHTQWRFYCIFTAMCGGLIGMASSQTLFGFFLFWEIMSSWALYMALAHEGDKVSLQEAFKYFLFNIAGASFIFVGVCVIGGSAPMMVFPGMTLASLPQGAPLGTGLALLAIGFVMKAAQLPLRIDWQMHPAVAPTPVSGYISSMLLKSSIIGLCKLFLILGAGAGSVYNMAQSGVIMWIGGITIVLAAWQAMRADHVKLVFIYSTVSQIGYMVLAVAAGAYALACGTGATLGFSGGLLHLINHVFFKDLLFLVCGAIMFMTHKDHLSELGGLGRRMPFTMLMFLIAGLSVVGVPPTSGFSSKWVIYHALMQCGQPVLAILSLFGSVLTLAYIAKFMHAAFLGQENPALDHVKDAPAIMRVPMLILAAGCVLTGIFPGIMLSPINAVIAQYNIPPVPFTFGSIGEGVTAWNPLVLFIIMAVPFAAGCWVIHRFVRLREIDVHNCGLAPEESADRIGPASIYGGLPAFFRNLARNPFGREE